MVNNSQWFIISGAIQIDKLSDVSTEHNSTKLKWRSMQRGKTISRDIRMHSIALFSNYITIPYFSDATLIRIFEYSSTRLTVCCLHAYNSSAAEILQYVTQEYTRKAPMHFQLPQFTSNFRLILQLRRPSPRSNRIACYLIASGCVVLSRVASFGLHRCQSIGTGAWEV